MARQSTSVSTFRWSTTKSRNAISAGSLRVVMTPLRHSMQPQNGTGQASPEEAQALRDDGIAAMPLLVPIVPPDAVN